MLEFFNLYESLRKARHPLTLNIYQSRIMDWCIIIKYGEDVIVESQSCDKDAAFARAFVQLVDWFCENKGGY